VLPVHFHVDGECRTDCIFSPDDKFVITGTSVKKGEGIGKLLFLDRQTLKIAAELNVASESASCTNAWHHMNLLRHVCIAESEPYCHSILFVCLSVGHCTTYSLPRLIDHSQIWSAGIYTCPWTRVSLFGSPVSHTLGARGKNMQNFAYFQRIFLPLRT